MRWLRRLFSLQNKKSNNALSLKRVRPCVETLEERQVPTVQFQPYTDFGAFTANDHVAMQHPDVHFIFAGAYWQTTAGQADEAKMINSAKSMLAGPYLNEMSQYGSDGRAVYAGSWNDLASPGSHPSNEAMQHYLQTSIDNHRSQAPGNLDNRHDPLYIVVTGLLQTL